MARNSSVTKGVVLSLRDKRTWPIIGWVAYYFLLINLLFFPSAPPGHFRYSLLPGLMVFAGAALAWALSRFRDWGESHRVAQRT